MKNSNHPFHLVDYRPWPLTGAIGVIVLVTGIVKRIGIRLAQIDNEN